MPHVGINYPTVKSYVRGRKLKLAKSNTDKITCLKSMTCNKQDLAHNTTRSSALSNLEERRENQPLKNSNIVFETINLKFQYQKRN